MVDRSIAKLAKEVFSRTALGNKYEQVIFNVQISTTPTSARITFVPMYDGHAWVWLYQTDGDDPRTRVREAEQYAPGHYGVTFKNLPQNTTFSFKISVGDPRPLKEQRPGGPVTYSNLLQTGIRTASVHLDSLKEVQGEGEITYYTKLYGWNGLIGEAISDTLQYGRGHMDPEGSPIGSPFGAPVVFQNAPDAIAFYTLAVVDTSSFWSFLTAPVNGLEGIRGRALADIFPNNAPSHTVYPTEIHTTAQKIVGLPSNRGSYSVPFSYMSGIYDYVFEIRGRIEGEVRGFTRTRLSYVMSPGQLDAALALHHSPRATLAAGETMLHFELTSLGSVVRLCEGARTAGDFECIGDISAERLFAVGCTDGKAHLVALRSDGALLHARAGTAGAVDWRELESERIDTLAVSPGAEGSLHVFALDVAGALHHAEIHGRKKIHWERWGNGFDGWISCAADKRGETRLLARRGAGIVQALVSLEDREISPPCWETLETPSLGPIMIAACEDRGFAALTCDNAQIFWLMNWDGAQPCGWERIGTIEDVLSGGDTPPSEPHR